MMTHIKKHQRGVSLIEVLVAMLITTVGLLGFASIQSKALLATSDGYLRTTAMSVAQDMMERMRLNGVSPTSQSLAFSTAPTAAQQEAQNVYLLDGNWTGTIPAAQDCSPAAASPCTTSAQMALYDVYDVRTQLASGVYLPGGSVYVSSCPSGKQVCVFVAWGGEAASSTTAAKACYTALGTALAPFPSNCILLQGV
jgi:type IV pilus assembly protein PilV